MSVTQSRSWCSTCQEHTLHERHFFGAGWGCLLTILTGGIFIPIWLLISLCETVSNPPRCQKCGGGHPSTMQAITIGFLLLLVGLGVLGWFVYKTDVPRQRRPTTPAAPIAKPIETNPRIQAPGGAIVAETPPPIPAAPIAKAMAVASPSLRFLGVGETGKLGYPNGPQGLQVLVGHQSVIWLAIQESAWKEMLDAENANSLALMYRLAHAEKVKAYPVGTKVLVAGQSIFARKVTIIGGEDDGDTGWVQVEFVLPIAAEIPPASASPPDPVAQAAAKAQSDKLQAELNAMQQESHDATHAASLLAIARNLEKNGKTAAAISSYREVITKYPSSAEAKTAKGRVKALGH